MTQCLFLKFSELQVRVDGVGAMPRQSVHASRGGVAAVSRRCRSTQVVEARMRQLCSASSNLYRRALEAMDTDTRSLHDSTTSSLQTEDPLRDEARLNRLRLLLTWTTAPNGLFQSYDAKHKTHVHRVGLTGPSLLKDHIATLFPPSVEYAFISGERHVYTALLSWTPSSHSDELFVGGVSKRMKAVELQKHFEQFGSVENVDIITDKTGADSASVFDE